jgi:peptidoglycan/xylan/chitin deacetylase (PgdA/CDA1 family)
MTWLDIKFIMKDGLISIGSHTYDLHWQDPKSKSAPPETGLTTRRLSKYDKEKDLKRSKILLQRNLGITINTIAYPYGEINDEVVHVVRSAGYHYGFTTTSGIVSIDTDKLRIPRINAGSPWVTVTYLDNKIKAVLRDSALDKQHKTSQ